jgi:hypothetical protein
MDMQRVITPQVWGEDLWRCIHVVALGYPLSGADADERQRAGYRAFYTSLRDVLPCSHCREEFGRLLGAYDIDAALDGGKEALFQWTVDVHNAAARRMGKPEMSALFVRRSYVFNDGARNGSKRGNGAKGGAKGGHGAKIGAKGGDGAKGGVEGGDGSYMRLSSAVASAAVAAAVAAGLVYWWTRGSPPGAPRMRSR